MEVSTQTSAQASLQVCPACHSTRLRTSPPSRMTGRSISSCRVCGMRAWANRPPAKVTVTTREDFSGTDYDGYVGIKRTAAMPVAWRECLRMVNDLLGSPESRSLYDIGAGDGEFLAMARDEFGFQVAGSEISEGAGDLARERYGVELEIGDLAELGHRDEFDAATLWCVLAHTPDGDELLGAVRDLLRPGGVVFLQTPRWTSADEAAHRVLRATGGRVSRLVDRRVAEHHWILHSRTSIRRQLERLGFEVLSVQPKVRYSLCSASYLGSIGVPDRAAPMLSSVLDRAIEGRAMFRIVLDVCARKPR